MLFTAEKIAEGLPAAGSRFMCRYQNERCSGAEMEFPQLPVPLDQWSLDLDPGFADVDLVAALLRDHFTGLIEVSLEPKGGYVEAGTGEWLLEQRLDWLNEDDRTYLSQRSGERIFFYYDDHQGRLVPRSERECLLADLEVAANAFLGLKYYSTSPGLGEEWAASVDFGELDLDPVAWQAANAAQDVVLDMRRAVARAALKLFARAGRLHLADDLVTFRELRWEAEGLLSAQRPFSSTAVPAEPDASVRRIFERPSLVARANEVFRRFEKSRELRVSLVTAPAIGPGAASVAGREVSFLRDQGIEVEGKVIVAVPGRYPYLRPTGWSFVDGAHHKIGFESRQGRAVWLDDGRIWSKGQAFSQSEDGLLEGGFAEQADYQMTSGRVLAALLGRPWPNGSGLEHVGMSPFARGPAPAVKDVRERGKVAPHPWAGLDISDLAGSWSPASALRSLVLSRSEGREIGAAFRSSRLEDASLAVTYQDLSESDVLRSSRRFLLGFLGPRAALLPQAQRACGFGQSPMGWPWRGTGMDPDLQDAIEILRLDREQLRAIREEGLEDALSIGDHFEADRLRFSMDYASREVVTVSGDICLPPRLRPDVVEAMDAFREEMTTRGAELIYIPSADLDPEGEVERRPFDWGWVPGGLLDLSLQPSPEQFERAARIAAGMLGWSSFLDLRVNSRKDDRRDAFLVVDDLPDEEVLFSEFALFMSGEEYRRRSAVLASNGVDDLKAPSWKKVDRIDGYAIDRFSPLLAPRWMAMKAPFTTSKKIVSKDFSNISREVSYVFEDSYVMTGMGFPPGDRREVDLAELTSILSVLYER